MIAAFLWQIRITRKTADKRLDQCEGYDNMHPEYGDAEYDPFFRAGLLDTMGRQSHQRQKERATAYILPSRLYTEDRHRREKRIKYTEILRSNNFAT